MWSGFPEVPGVQGIWSLVVLIGMLVGIFRIREGAWRNRFLILWIWGLSVAAGILWGVSILWQRYFILQMPVLSVWAGVGVAWLISRFSSRDLETAS
jgi:hypothetical protein